MKKQMALFTGSCFFVSSARKSSAGYGVDGKGKSVTTGAAGASGKIFFQSLLLLFVPRHQSVLKSNE